MIPLPAVGPITYIHIHYPGPRYRHAGEGDAVGHDDVEDDEAGEGRAGQWQDLIID